MSLFEIASFGLRPPRNDEDDRANMTMHGEAVMRVVFGEPDKMFRLIGEALAPSVDGERFLAGFFLTESADPVDLLRRWSARRKIPPGINVSYCTRPENLAAMLAEATVLVIENDVVRAEHLALARSLKLIQLFGREAPGLDLEACARNNILVRPLDRHSNRLVAEHVIMLMLALTRGLDASRAALQGWSWLNPGSWAYNWPACTGVRGLAGRVIGLVGLGHIGALVADYLRPFGATVLYTRRTRDPAVEERLGITFATLDELVARSDVLSLHVSESAETRNLISAGLLARAKPGLFLVNTARGSLIDEDALVVGLEGGRIAGAALDVFVTEPLADDHPLRRARNVILTPHVAAGSRDEAWLDREIGPVVDSIVSVL
jgi:phosphoglycerate dehydrogenase-like enzyme